MPGPVVCGRSVSGGALAPFAVACPPPCDRWLPAPLPLNPRSRCCSSRPSGVSARPSRRGIEVEDPRRWLAGREEAWLASGEEEAVLVEVAGGSLSTATLDAPPTTACWPLAVVAIAMRGCVGLPKICNAALCQHTEGFMYNLIGGGLHVIMSDSRFERITFPYGSPLPEVPFNSPLKTVCIDADGSSSSTSSSNNTKTTTAPEVVARVHISSLTPEVFHEKYRSPGIPVVIQGALPSPPHRWALRPFVNLFEPDASYHCRIHGSDGFARVPSAWHGKSHARHVIPTTPHKFAETISSGLAAREDCYVQADIQNTRAGNDLAPSLDAIGRQCGLQQHRLYGAIVNMWWGAPGHTEPLHMDVTDGTLCQLRGRKTVVLFPAHCWRESLYPFPASATGMSWAFSQVVQSQPDLEKFPKLREGLEHKMEVHLEEGEVLYIPACCAHEISGEADLSDGSPADHVLSMNRFWRTDPDLVRKHLPVDALADFNRTLAV